MNQWSLFSTYIASAGKSDDERKLRIYISVWVNRLRLQTLPINSFVVRFSIIHGWMWSYVYI
jgi:hypothetical protein